MALLLQDGYFKTKKYSKVFPLVKEVKIFLHIAWSLLSAHAVFPAAETTNLTIRFTS